jgi:hypothetical protein
MPFYFSNKRKMVNLLVGIGILVRNILELGDSSPDL